jgi:tetratricopeptide (TPR) repeat protein
MNCHSGDSLAQEQVRVNGKSEVLKGLDQAVLALRNKLGESLSSVRKFDTPIEQATTPSLEALNAFSQGVNEFRLKGDAEAIPFYKQAIAIDPQFAMAYSYLAISYSNLGQDDLAEENAKKAYELRDRVSEREKFQVTAFYHDIVTGDLKQEEETCNVWAHTYPRAAEPHIQLGAIYRNEGRYEQAVTEKKRALDINPEFSITHASLALSYVALGQMGDARNVLDQAEARHLSSQLLHYARYFIAFLDGDQEEMQRQLAWSNNRQGSEDWLLAAQAQSKMYVGRLADARALLRQASESALRANSKESAALWHGIAALNEVEVGNAAEARRQVQTAMATTRSHDAQLFAALTLAQTGDALQAHELAANLSENDPQDTMLKFYWMPCVEATIELKRGNPEESVKLLEPAIAYEVGVPSPLQQGPLYPAYMRGQAYLAAGNPRAAVTEFQKLTLHRGIVLNFPTGVLAHLQLGRAYAMAGDTAKARSTYQDFFGLWKDADPEIPILRQAKAEYEKLK